MKHIRLVLGIIGIITASLAAVAQQQPAPPQAPPAAGQPQAPPPGATPQAAIDSPLLRSYSTVSKARLLKPEDRNWLMIRRTYDGWGYSPLDKITPANVSRLKMVWSAKTDEVGAHQAPPLINNGVMFISTPNNQVAAYDAVKGTLLWRYKRVRPATAFVAHPSNRGLALYGDKVYYGAGEAVVVALDAKTGKEVWAKEVFDNKVRYYITLAPLAADGKILVGASGGEFGVRGYVAALDPEDGKEIWRTYTVPAPGEPGSETWPKGDHWKTGGASVWVTGNYDPDTNIAYWGTGNGGPWMGDARPGDNLYVASTVALDATTGKLKGHFQYNPNESWDWDEVSPPLLIDFRRNGREVKGLINASRSGYLWFLERTKDGPIRFVDGKPYVNQTVYRSLDPKTGRPDVDPDKKPGTGKEAQYCPGLHGGKNWPPAAYSPRTRMMYIPANNFLCSTMAGVPVTYQVGQGFTGSKGGGTQLWPGADHVGEVQAWNVDTGQKMWSHNYKMANWGPLLATGGGLVFGGGTPDQKFHAFDATTGKLLWEFETSSGVEGPPASFEVGGRQYIAVLTGWGADASGMGATVARFFPNDNPKTTAVGGAVYVFAID